MDIPNRDEVYQLVSNITRGLFQYVNYNVEENDIGTVINIVMFIIRLSYILASIIYRTIIISKKIYIILYSYRLSLFVFLSKCVIIHIFIDTYIDNVKYMNSTHIYYYYPLEIPRIIGSYIWYYIWSRYTVMTVLGYIGFKIFIFNMKPRGSSSNNEAFARGEGRRLYL